MSRMHVEPYLAVAEERLGRWVGIDLGRGGVARTVRKHVEARVRALGDPGTSRFGSLLDEPGSVEARALVEAATVPHSWLFRDAVQLDAVTEALRARAKGPLAIWVAGCANGEDAVTFAVLARAHGHTPTVLATDVNESALTRARLGRFDAWKSREIPDAARPYLRADERGGTRVGPEIAAAIVYRRHSLLDAPPHRDDGGAFDLVVCRNVLIYFSRDDARGVVDRLVTRLSPGGMLVLGTSDVLAALPPTLAPRAGATRLVLVRTTHDVSARAHVTTPSMRIATTTTPRADVARRRDLAPPAQQVAATETVSPHVAVLTALDTGEHDRARALAEHLVASRDDAETRVLAGLACRALDDQRSAATHFAHACRAAPGCWVAWLHLGLASERLGRFAEARAALHRVPLAAGDGEDLPRGPGDLVESLHGYRKTFVRFAIARAAAIQGGGNP